MKELKRSMRESVREVIEFTFNMGRIIGYGEGFDAASAPAKRAQTKNAARQRRFRAKRSAKKR